jgi:hypothetical protein
MAWADIEDWRVVFSFQEHRWDWIYDATTTVEDVLERYKMENVRAFVSDDGVVVAVVASLKKCLVEYRPRLGPLILECRTWSPVWAQHSLGVYVEMDGVAGAFEVVLRAETLPSQLSEVCWSISGTCHEVDVWFVEGGMSKRLHDEVPVQLQVRDLTRGLATWEFSVYRRTERRLRPRRHWRPPLVYQCIWRQQRGLVRELVAPQHVYDIAGDWDDAADAGEAAR